MLDLSGDTASNIQFGTDGYTRLANLAVMVCITCIDSCTAGTYFGVKFFGQFEQFVKTFFRSHAIASGNHDRCAFQVMFGFFYVTVNDFDYIVCFRNKLGNVVVHHFTLIIFIQNLFLHHSLTNGRHLRAVLGVDNGCNDVTTEGGTNLIQQIFISDAVLLVFVGTDFQLGTVGSQSAGQCGRYTRSQIAADNSSAHQTDLWLFLFEQIHQNGSMGQ